MKCAHCGLDRECELMMAPDGMEGYFCVECAYYFEMVKTGVRLLRYLSGPGRILLKDEARKGPPEKAEDSL